LVLGWRYRSKARSGAMLDLAPQLQSLYRYERRAVSRQTLTSVLDPSVWTNCYGQHDTSGFAGALENAMGIGFTFGGRNFFGHGVYLSSGSATFKVNSYTVR
jgi:hypothetical protein